MEVSKKQRTYLSIAVCILLLTFIAIGVKNNSFSVFSSDRKLPIYSVETSEKKIAISFDASWGADNTEKLLDILDKYKVKTTFFLVGGWVDKYPDKVKEIHERGHEIGNHSNTHPDMTSLSKEKIIQEVASTDAKVMTITGQKTKLFRFPSGSYNNSSMEAVESTNHKCIQWDVDSVDWKEQGAKAEYDRVMKNVKSGSIVLFHNNAKYTPENLPKILEQLQAEGYKIVPISQLIYMDNYELDHTGKQINNNKQTDKENKEKDSKDNGQIKENKQ